MLAREAPETLHRLAIALTGAYPWVPTSTDGHVQGNVRCQQAACRHRRLMAVTVNSRRLQEPDFRCDGPVRQSQLAATSGKTR